jgi:Divergent InlB B-repeat domain
VRQTFLLAIAAAALLSLAGGAYAHANVDQALAVAVDGPGQVNGTGIACRDGSGDCVELYADGTSVTLTAVSDAGAVFTGWGGDCTASGTNATCTLTMSSAKAVTATFTAGGGGVNPILTVSATGNGKVTGNGINCGAASTGCSENYAPGTTVTLTAVPNTGAAFLGWGGDCVAAGTNTTCTVTMSASKNATASFSGATGTTFSTPGTRAGSTFAVHSNGTPLVARTSVGWAVTLRFFTSRPAGALLRLSQTGRAVHVFRFSPKAGNVLVGPFNVPRSGKYRFQMTLSDGHGGIAGLTWNLCLGACARSRSAS